MKTEQAKQIIDDQLNGFADVGRWPVPLAQRVSLYPSWSSTASAAGAAFLLGQKWVDAKVASFHVWESSR